MSVENCFLCHRYTARITAFDDERRRRVECTHCVDYTITSGAAVRVRSSSPEYRQALQRAAGEVNTDDALCLIALTNTGELVCVELG